MAAALVAASAPFRSAGRGAGQAGHLGRHLEQLDLAVPQLGDIGGAGGGDLVEPVGAMDDPGALGAERGQHLGHGLDPGLGEDAEKLAPRPGRIGERAHEIEDGAGAELDPRGADMAHGAVMTGRHEEADIGAPQRLADQRHIGIDIDAQGAQHIGGARSWRRRRDCHAWPPARRPPRSRWPPRWRC